jgi:YHS domain-containing protein
MKLQKLALAIGLAASLNLGFAIAQDTQKAAQKPAKEEKDLVCGMTVDPKDSDTLKSQYKGKTYYFCSDEHKKEFDKAPAKYIDLDKKDTTKK